MGAPLTAHFNRNFGLQEIDGEWRRPLRFEPTTSSRRRIDCRRQIRPSAVRRQGESLADGTALFVRALEALEDGEANEALCELLAQALGVAGAARSGNEEPAETGRGDRGFRGTDGKAGRLEVEVAKQT